MKPLEIIFFILVVKFGERLSVRDIINILGVAGVSHKQLLYFLRKWSGKGFYNYGVSLDLGWLETDKLSGYYSDLYTLASMSADSYPFALTAHHIGYKEAKEMQQQFNKAFSSKPEPVSFFDKVKELMRRPPKHIRNNLECGEAAALGIQYGLSTETVFIDELIGKETET